MKPTTRKQTRSKPVAWLVLLAVAHATFATADDKVKQQLIDAPAGAGLRLWPSQPPEDCPFPRSESFGGIEFTGRHADYTGADTWYPSWATDGNLYSPWADGYVSWWKRPRAPRSTSASPRSPSSAAMPASRLWHGEMMWGFPDRTWN